MLCKCGDEILCLAAPAWEGRRFVLQTAGRGCAELPVHYRMGLREKGRFGLLGGSSVAVDIDKDLVFCVLFLGCVCLCLCLYWIRYRPVLLISRV